MRLGSTIDDYTQERTGTCRECGSGPMEWVSTRSDWTHGLCGRCVEEQERIDEYNQTLIDELEDES